MSEENKGAAELSDDELDMVAGGSALMFSATFFEQIDSIKLENSHANRYGSFRSSLIATRHIKTYAIQGLFFGEIPNQFGFPKIGD